MKELSEKPMLYVNYRTCSGGGLEYYQMKAVRVGQWKKEHTAVLGFHSIDEEIRNEIEQKKQLEDALAQAEKASRAKTTFLNNMSHDIRTPMNAVIGFTALASSHLDNKEQVQDYLTKIMTSSNHLLSLINDVLDMSRIESGQIHIEEVPCNLSEIMQDLKVVMIGQVQEKQIELHIDTEAVRNENIYCDKLRLNQILLNLLGNAVKFTGEQGSISVRVVQTPEILVEGYAVYEFHVIDNGIGMSEEFQKHLFEPFSRARTSTVSGLQGTGLGLSITKNIVDLMGGTIAVTSRENEGTEITVKLNLKLQPDSQKADEQAAACEEINAKEEKVNFAGKRILLAEDNELNREIAVDILKEYGFEIKSVENGQEAVSEIAGSEVGCYDAVLMDIQMPVMDGYEATRAIRSLSNRQLAQIPVIAMTANAFAEDKRLSKAAGMDGYVAKPVDIGRLIDTLSRIIK
jgi:signal transduction histidine kinase/CheY-like chemotaxis protein